MKRPKIEFNAMKKPKIEEGMSSEDRCSIFFYYYVKDSDVKQGPFKESEMQHWYKSKYFPSNMRVIVEFSNNGQKVLDNFTTLDELVALFGVLTPFPKTSTDFDLFLRTSVLEQLKVDKPEDSRKLIEPPGFETTEEVHNDENIAPVARKKKATKCLKYIPFWSCISSSKSSSLTIVERKNARELARNLRQQWDKLGKLQRRRFQEKLRMMNLPTHCHYCDKPMDLTTSPHLFTRCHLNMIYDSKCFITRASDYLKLQNLIKKC